MQYTQHLIGYHASRHIYNSNNQRPRTLPIPCWAFIIRNNFVHERCLHVLSVLIGFQHRNRPECLIHSNWLTPVMSFNRTRIVLDCHKRILTLFSLARDAGPELADSKETVVNYFNQKNHRHLIEFKINTSIIQAIKILIYVHYMFNPLHERNFKSRKYLHQ